MSRSPCASRWGATFSGGNEVETGRTASWASWACFCLVLKKLGVSGRWSVP